MATKFIVLLLLISPLLESQEKYYYPYYQPQYYWYPGQYWYPGRVYNIQNQYFYKAVNPGVRFINFYLPDCEPCKPVHKPFKKAADKCKVADDVPFAEVDCKEAVDKCKKMNVDETPSIVWVEKGVPNGTFNGQFNLDEIVKFFWKKHNESDITNPKNSEPPSVEITLSVYLAVFGLYFISYVTMYLD